MQSSLEVNIPFGDPSLIKVALLYFLVYLSAPSVCSLSFPTFILVFYTVTHNVRFGEWMSSFPFSVDKVKWNIIPCAEILLSWDKLITYESKKQKPTACDQASHHHLEPCRYLKLYHCASVWSLWNWNCLHSTFTSSTPYFLKAGSSGFGRQLGSKMENASRMGAASWNLLSRFLSRAVG